MGIDEHVTHFSLRFGLAFVAVQHSTGREGSFSHAEQSLFGETTWSKTAKVLQLAMIQLAWICWRHFGGGAGWWVSTGGSAWWKMKYGSSGWELLKAWTIGAGILMLFLLIPGKDGERKHDSLRRPFFFGVTEVMDHACRMNTFLSFALKHSLYIAGASEWNVQMEWTTSSLLQLLVFF